MCEHLAGVNAEPRGRGGDGEEGGVEGESDQIDITDFERGRMTRIPIVAYSRAMFGLCVRMEE